MWKKRAPSAATPAVSSNPLLGFQLFVNERFVVKRFVVRVGPLRVRVYSAAEPLAKSDNEANEKVPFAFRLGVVS
jgi:hypothetical protein